MILGVDGYMIYSSQPEALDNTNSSVFRFRMKSPYFGLCGFDIASSGVHLYYKDFWNNSYVGDFKKII